MWPFCLQTKHVAWGRLPSACFGLGQTLSACRVDPQLKQMPVEDWPGRYLTTVESGNSGEHGSGGNIDDDAMDEEEITDMIPVCFV